MGAKSSKTYQDVVIVGSGAAGLFCALQFPKEVSITIITKSTKEESDSYLAQGGMCMLPCEEDYASFYEDTMKAGHYENRKESVEIMIKGSVSVAEELVELGVDFANENGKQIGRAHV